MHDGSERGRETEDRRGCERGPDDPAELILWWDPQHPTDHERIADALDHAAKDEPDDEADDPPVERSEAQPTEDDGNGGRERGQLCLVTTIEGQIAGDR